MMGVLLSDAMARSTIICVCTQGYFGMKRWAYFPLSAKSSFVILSVGSISFVVFLLARMSFFSLRE